MIPLAPANGINSGIIRYQVGKPLALRERGWGEGFTEH